MRPAYSFGPRALRWSLASKVGAEDRVADNSAKYDIAESESLLIGRDFGVLTDIQTSPSGTLYVVSVSDGAIYEITRRAR
jgi:hypothetical protein